LVLLLFLSPCTSYGAYTTYNEKISLVVQQERQLAINFSVSNINSANSNHISSFVICTFCGKNGHSENACFHKVGFPNQENKFFKNNGNKKICTHYGINGHTIETCY